MVGALAGGIGLALAEARSAQVRSVLATLTVLGLLLGVWAVGPSRVGSYVRSSGDAAPVVTHTVDTPVVFLVFDEVSMIPMLNDDLTINAERFPNVAALAETSHWYRQASSVSPQTSASVPALLSGVAPDLGKVPVGSDYPTNIFRQLGGSMDATAHEPVTALCPGTVCRGDDGDEGGAGSLSGLVGDTALVLRQAVSSDAMRDSLPSINQGWAGFGGSGTPDIDAEVAPSGGYGTIPVQAEELTSLVTTEAGGRPDLIVGHFIAPHMPWISLPDGSTYAGAEPQGLAATSGTLEWTGTEADRRLGYQRYLLQVGALDKALGEARAALEEEGLWDEAIVVVTADHGVQFEPGGARAVGAGGAEVTNVPLFIKEPHQREGVVESASALTIDALPTVLGLLDVSAAGDLDGVDLLAGKVPAERRDGFLVSKDDPVTPDQRLSAITDAVERRSAWIDPGGTWDDVYEIGASEELVGTALADHASGPSGGTWTRAAGESGPMITFDLLASVTPTEVVAVCGGTVAGAAPVAGTRAKGALFVSPDHCADPDAAELFVLDAAGALHPIASTT